MYVTGCTCTSVPNWKVVLSAAWSHLAETINTTATVISDVLAHTAVLEAQGGWRGQPASMEGGGTF